MIMGAKTPDGMRAVVAASIAFLCACGARSEVDATDPAATPSSGNHDCDVDEWVEPPGCILHAYNISGAELGPTTLTFPESPAVFGVPGYWTDSVIGVVGKDGDGRWFQLWGDPGDGPVCGRSLPLVPTMAETHPQKALLRWALPAAQWTSTSGTLEVIANEPDTYPEKRPIRFEVHGAPMAPSPEQPGDATGMFTVDLSCRLETFWFYD